MKDRYCIIPAALKFIWPEGKKLIFPGEWTYRYEDTTEIKSNKHICVKEEPLSYEQIWKDRNEHLFYYVERCLREVSDMLDGYHKEKHDYHYWELLLGTWMCFFVSGLYGAYSHVKRQSNLYNHGTYIICDRKVLQRINGERIVGFRADGEVHYFSDSDYRNFECYIAFSRVLWIMSENKDYDIQVCPDGIEYVFSNADSPKDSLTISETIKESVKNILLARADVVGIYDHDSTKNVLWKTRGNIRFDLPKCVNTYQEKTQYQYDDRLLMAREPSGDDEFENILCRLVPFCLPKDVVEEYNYIIDVAKKNLPKAPKVVNLLQLANVSTMVMFGEWQKKGTLFAREACSLADQMIKNVENTQYGVDIYYTWSKYVNDGGKYRTKPTYKRLYHNKGLKEHNEDILWCASGFGVNSAVDVLEGYLAPLCDTISYMPLFLDSLDEKLKRNIVYRDRDISGWGYASFYQEKYPCIRIDGQNKKGVIGAKWFNFAERCAESKVVVSETLITGVVGEAFWINTPCIIVDPDAYQRGCSWIEYEDDLISSLEECGILHTKPESAAFFLNENFENIEEWWMTPKVQTTIHRFLDTYFLESENIDDWLVDEVNCLSRIK